MKKCKRIESKLNIQILNL